MNKKQNSSAAIGIVLLSLMLGLAVGAVIIGVFSSNTPDNISDISMMSMAISTLFIALPVIIYLRYRRLRLAPALRLNKISAITLLATILISVGVIILIDEVDRLIYILFGQPDYLSELAEQLKITSFSNGLLLIFTTALIAPLVEEILFRGFLQKTLEESWQDVTKAVLFTALFFALVHLNPYWVVQIYLLGVILGYLSWRTNSIWPSLILHGLNNGLAVALNNATAIFNKYYNWYDHVNPLWITISIISLLIGFKIINRDMENHS